MKNDLVEAVKALRKALGDTQRSFAERLKLAIPTVVRYESTRAPSGKALAQLAHVASSNGFHEYAAIFRRALADESAGEVQPRIDFSQDERDYVLGLLAALRNDEYSELAAEVKTLLDKPRRVCLEILQAHRVARGVKRAALRLLAEGRDPNEVAEMLGTPIQQIEQLAAWQKFIESMKEAGLMK